MSNPRLPPPPPFGINKWYYMNAEIAANLMNVLFKSILYSIVGVRYKDIPDKHKPKHRWKPGKNVRL
jgi:hypothetical protein